VDREQRAKATAAAGLFALVVAAVFLFWFVLPAMQSGNVAMAQEGGEAGPPEAGGGAPGMTGEPGMEGVPPGMEGAPPGMGGGAPGMGMGGPGGPGGAPAAAAAPSGPSSPLEPSRPNPFAPLDTPEPEDRYVTSSTKYGHDWSQVPMGYFYDLPQPGVPPGPPAPIPPNPMPAADLVRISSVVWPARDVGTGAPGRAFATYENPEGETRVAVPGSEIVVTHPVTADRRRGATATQAEKPRRKALLGRAESV
jgi:hypothetical protein